MPPPPFFSMFPPPPFLISPPPPFKDSVTFSPKISSFRVINLNISSQRVCAFNAWKSFWRNCEEEDFKKIFETTNTKMRSCLAILILHLICRSKRHSDADLCWCYATDLGHEPECEGVMEEEVYYRDAGSLQHHITSIHHNSKCVRNKKRTRGIAKLRCL